MQRIIGRKKKTEDSLRLEDVVPMVNSKADIVEAKIKVLNSEFKKCKDELQKMRDGPAKTSVRQRAMRLLQQKKVYEKQLDTLRQHAFNVEQASFAVQSAKDAHTTVGAMKSGVKELKKELQKINVEDIDDLQDDMTELQEIAEEMQGALGRTYDMPLFDEDELDAELEALADEIVEDDDTSYLDEAIRANDVMNTAPSGSQKKAEELKTDEFGLPQIPNDPL